LNRLKHMLTIHEGKSKYAYELNGVIHVGIGRNIDRNGGLGLSDEECLYLLENDILLFMKELAQAFSWFGDLDEVRQEALIMICFTMGISRLKLFVKALGHLEQGLYKDSAREFLDSRWSTQIGERAVVLAGMIETGKYPDGYEVFVKE